MNTKLNEVKNLFLRLVYRISVTVGNKRDIILLVDNVWEKKIMPLDNIALFRYIYAHPEYGYKPIYLANPQNEHYKKLKEEYGDNIVPYSNHQRDNLGLLKYLLHTRYMCNSFQRLYLDLLIEIRKSTKIISFFTQHGITFFKPDFVSPTMYGQEIFDKVIVSNEMEKRIFIEKCNYSEDNIIIDGLFRWDEVHDNSEGKKIIFIYFTFRRYLQCMDPAEVSECKYIRTLKAILSDKRFKQMVSDNGITVKLSVHHFIRDLIDDNEIFEGIELVSEEDIKSVKEDASLLITDFSSMCFEVMRLNKPVIFYNAMDDEDIKKYGQDDLAPYDNKEQYLYHFVSSVEDMDEHMAKIISNSFRLDDKESEINNQFFYYRENYCRRFMEKLQEYDKNIKQ